MTDSISARLGSGKETYSKNSFQAGKTDEATELLRALHTSVTAAGASSLSDAARRLSVTPSAVSKQLAALEAELGVILLSPRRGRRYWPGSSSRFPDWRGEVTRELRNIYAVYL